MTSNSGALRVGIIGAGIGARHLEGFRALPQAHVAAICDLDEARARRLAAKHQLPDAQIFADFRAMLDSAQLDAVSVCLPNALHLPVAVACLDAGLHVLCEKPLAINAAEARLIEAAAQRNGRQCMVGQVLRFRPDSQFLKAESATLGRIYYAHAGSLRVRGIPGWGGWFTTQRESGGGALIDMGVHLLDLAWWLCGCPRPVAASGVTFAEFGPQGRGLGSGGAQRPGGTFDVEDLAIALLRFEGGLAINLEISWALNTDEPRGWCQVFGSEGGLLWGDEAGVVREIEAQAQVARPDLPPRETWRAAMWQAQCAHFLDCAARNVPPNPDAAQGVTLMTMLDAVYRSAREGREVAVG